LTVPLAKGHIERIVLEQFIEAVNKCEDASTKQVLKMACDLYALSWIESNGAFFLERGWLKKFEMKKVHSLVSRLCYTLKDRALQLIDAFGIPAKLLHAPIALDDFKAKL